MLGNNVCLLLKTAVFGIFLFIVIYYPSESLKMSGKKLISVEFEIYGQVQGVFFRKHTQQESLKLGLKGWCMNTERGTVQGVMEGEEPKVNEMKRWLQVTGSPSSKIEKADFRNQKEISSFSFSNFAIKR